MKKLMVTITAVAMGISAHAAAVDWYVDVYDAGFSGAELGEFTTYILNGNTAATLAAYLTSGTYADASDFSTALSAADKVTTAFDTTDAYADGSLNNVGEYISVLFLANTTEGSKVYYTDGISTAGYTYSPPDSAPAVLEAYYNSFSAGTIAYSHEPPGPTPPTPIPEPTSGLLLLLGIAGLALKRKRA